MRLLWCGVDMYILDLWFCERMSFDSDPYDFVEQAQVLKTKLVTNYPPSGTPITDCVFLLRTAWQLQRLTLNTSSPRNIGLIDL